MTFEAVQKVADAVLYEGYLLYPYQASSDKNRVRFQFGVVAPRDFSVADGSESWEMQTDCLLEAGAAGRVDIRIRFLQLQARTVEAADAGAVGGFSPVASLDVGDEAVVPWDEAIEHQIDVAEVPIAELIRDERVVPIRIDGGREIEEVRGSAGMPTGRVVRTRWLIAGQLVLRAEPAGSLVRLRIRIENLTDSPADVAARAQVLRHSMLSCHTLVAVQGGAFRSLIDPPADAVSAARDCVNLHTWPVLAGDPDATDLLLSSPIILYDHPEVAPESQGDLYDSTEIDEILTLRIMTMSEAEKQAARATDPRARAIVDAADSIPPEMMDRLHGAIRYLRETPSREVASAEATTPVGADPAAGILPWSPDEPDWPVFREAHEDDRLEMPPSVWQPDARVPPDRAAIEIDGITISKGATVRLRPNRRADSMDVFLAGRLATVERVYESVDDDTHVAVTIDDDPGSDINRASGRFFYFAPDELEPLAPAPLDDGPRPIVLEPSARALGNR